MRTFMLKLPTRCIGAVASGIKGLVNGSKKCTLRVIRSKPSQKAIVIVNDGFTDAAPKLYYAAGALVGTVEGLWLEAR